MFAKPFRVKSNTPVKGSERKKVKLELKTFLPGLTDECLSTLIPNKDDMSIVKIETHSGEVVSSHIVAGRPVSFRIRDTLYPTVYLLWTSPCSGLPFFTTWAPVVSKLANGADLMLPGIIVDEALGLRSYGRLPKGQLVMVNTNENSAAVAIGRTALSSEDMYMAGRRGKGVEILHCVGDHLWQLGTKEAAPNLGPPLPAGATEETPDVSKEPQGVGVVIGEPENTLTGESVNNGERVDEDSGAAVTEPVMEETGKNPQELMDELLEYCFFKSLKTTAKKLELPVLTSNFYRLHVVAACPVGKVLDVKKSSYKKLSKFLDVMKHDGVVSVKELTKGAESITQIDYGHDRVRSFRCIDEPSANGQVDEAIESVAKDLGRYLPPVITQLYAVNAATAPLFAEGSFRKGANLTAQQVRKFLTDYVKQNNLQDQSQPGRVVLDPILSDVVLSKGDKSTPSLAWEELMNRCLGKLSPAFEMLFPGNDPIIVKGQLEPIELTTASRAGNKKVTLVSGLETFRIDLDEFAHRCQVGVAASSTVTTSPAKKGHLVLVQGNQVRFIGDLLLGHYAIPKQFIRGLDLKAPKKNTK